MISYRNSRGVVPGIVDRLELNAAITHPSYLPLCQVAEQMLTAFVPVQMGSQVNFGGSIRTVQDELREVTATMKVRRSSIHKTYAAEIEALYSQASSERRCLFPPLSQRWQWQAAAPSVVSI
jgi:long-chain acyl-CoA synthetase